MLSQKRFKDIIFCPTDIGIKLKYVFKNGGKEALKSLFVNDAAHMKLVKISFLLLEDEDDDIVIFCDLEKSKKSRKQTNLD